MWTVNGMSIDEMQMDKDRASRSEVDVGIVGSYVIILWSHQAKTFS